MSFLNTPVKSISVEISSVNGVESMDWNNPLLYPVIPPALPPAPVPRDYRWRVNMNVIEQSHSSYLTRAPGEFSGQDISVGLWIANLSTGQAWQIISIESKTAFGVTAIVQDIYRYNTYRDPAKVGNGTPSLGNYVVFNISDAGLPQIDPVPSLGISSQFSTNLFSRFEYINLQYDYPLYQSGNSFQVNDIIAADQATNSFVKSDSSRKLTIGRVTSVSDTIPGWFTINPVQKIVDFLDFLPGNIGDIIYTSTTVPGGLTLDPGGAQIYIKLRNETSSVSVSASSGPTTANNIFQINGTDITVSGSGSAADLVSAVNGQSISTGVFSDLIIEENTIQTNGSLISATYGEPALWASSSPASVTINGVLVTFDITSSDPGYEDYARPVQMAQSINNASIPGIVASAPSALVLKITNTTGGSITIVNVTNDINNVPFAGTGSGSGIALFTPENTNNLVKFTAIDARPINFLDVVGSVMTDFGLTSVENGTKACGLYIEEGLRNTTSTVVTNISQLNSLSPLIGDTAYVIDSNDGNGNNVNEWSLWLFDGAIWVQTSNQDSAGTDARSIEESFNFSSTSLIPIGTISTGRRVTLITVEIIEAFDPNSTLSIGFIVNNPLTPVTEVAGLMASSLIDLSTIGTYTATSDTVFGVDTPQGDVSIIGTYTPNGSISGIAKIVVSYV